MQDLIQFCQTDRQRQIIEAMIEHGSERKAAASLGSSKTAVNDAVSRVKKYAALKGYSPDHDMTHTVPDGFKVRGVSTYYNKDGQASGQWVKSSADDERRMEMMREAVEALKEDLPHYEAIHCEGAPNEDLLNVYVITDYHLSMKSWKSETGSDWDIEIAENLLVNWFAHAISHAPMAEHAVFAQLGDFLHADGLEAVTPQHRHQLDVDTRFQRSVRIAIRVIRKVIGMLLKKHERVTVIMAEGNHDLASSAWLRELFASVYQDEPRVTIDTNADAYYCVEHGDTALYFHHGHRRQVADIDRVFAGKYRQIFGRTKYAYAHLGHLHNNEVKESQLMVVERHRTLAAPDAYASKGGWISGRDAKVITYSKKFGEVGRLTINPEMVTK